MSLPLNLDSSRCCMSGIFENTAQVVSPSSICGTQGHELSFSFHNNWEFRKKRIWGSSSRILQLPSKVPLYGFADATGQAVFFLPMQTK